MILVEPKEDTMKFSCWYLYRKCVKKGGSRMGVLGRHWGFLTIDLEDRVILEIMDDLDLPQGRYPDIFLFIPLLEVCQEGGVKKGVLGGRWGFLTGELEDRVILDVMDDLGRPQGRYSENFVFISVLEVCQEWGVENGGTWRILRVPDRRLGGHGHPWCHKWSCLTLQEDTLKVLCWYLY